MPIPPAPGPPPGPPPRTPSGTPSRRRALRSTGLLAVPAVLLMTAVASGWRPLLDLDARIARELHSLALAHPAWTDAARVLTDWVWDPVTMRVLAAAAALALWWRAERALALLVAAAVGLGALVQQGLKALLDRARPEWQQPLDAAHYAAMPSGHAMTAALVCGLLTWLAWTRTRRAAVCWAAAAAAGVSVVGVSLTRVWLGVHWPSDVVTGALLGLALATLTAAAWSPRAPSGRIAA
ncbi:phosphatase PAP2 family protein [Streptomyces sp. JJ36]|uniref:phosphatase PAP2 family protein n=1 Tax=Streptomyces sp. JJ36 TaxID=2736645 RepID=UPI001F3D0D27|nr:phosphatase PAP2 family protein [Streptomyces sp. JJ36]MCF6525965.1 phosphatase PAP2 family protein [Streptomyces sp. JJ36]